jgi:hypothetical protein
MTSNIPTSKDVVAYLNQRMEALGYSLRLEHISVLPYMNPMWLANWEAPQLLELPQQDVIEEELREARWRFPQVMDEY